MLDVVLRSRAELVAEMVGHERVVASARAAQVVLLRRLMRGSGEPGVDELASLLDVSTRTAGDLLEAARRTPELSEAMGCLVSGEWSFDRAAAVAGLVAAGAGAETLQAAAGRDIAGVQRLAGLQRRITRRTEQEAFEQRSVRAWASLDQSVGFLSVQLGATDWQTVNAALDDRGGLLPRDAIATAAQRRADALVALANDWLDGRLSPSVESRSAAVVTISVDPGLAAATAGEAGAVIVGGPRVGPAMLEEILCADSVEVMVDAGSGVPLAVGPTSRVVPPKIRRFVIARDGGCVVDGCTSRYRLEVHHVVPRSEGGSHDAENLVTLCWYHHHVAIHGRGMSIDPQSPPGPRRLIPAAGDP